MEKSFITNVSFPKSLDEVLYFINVRGRFDVEEIMSSKYVEWTAPKSAHVGEAVYFMHSKTSIDTIRHLKKELKTQWDDIDAYARDALGRALEKGEELYGKVGGSIFAMGRVSGDIIVDEVATRDGLHWRSRYYAPIDSIVLVEPPIGIAEFRSFISVSRTGAITKLDDSQDEMLRSLRAL